MGEQSKSREPLSLLDLFADICASSLRQESFRARNIYSNLRILGKVSSWTQTPQWRKVQSCPPIGDTSIAHQGILCNPKWGLSSIPTTYSTALAIIEARSMVQAQAFWMAIYWESLRRTVNAILCDSDLYDDPKVNEHPAKISDSSQRTHSGGSPRTAPPNSSSTSLSSQSSPYILKRRIDRDGQNDGNGQPPPKKSKTLGISHPRSQNRPLLACPFHKWSPEKYLACMDPGWKSVSKMK